MLSRSFFQDPVFRGKDGLQGVIEEDLRLLPRVDGFLHDPDLFDITLPAGNGIGYEIPDPVHFVASEKRQGDLHLSQYQHPFLPFPSAAARPAI